LPSSEDTPVAAFPIVLTVPLVAERLITSPETIVGELEAGRLLGFKVGGEWRTTEEDLFAFIGHPVLRTPKESQEWESESVNGPPEVQATWRKTDEPFRFTWPKTAGTDPEESTEYYKPAFAGSVQWQGRNIAFRIGFTKRDAAGMQGRERVVVFLQTGSTFIPLVQFVGANDFDKTGRLASVIKNKDGRHLRPGEPVPVEYRGLPQCVYSEVVVGKNAARSIAVLAQKDNLTLMARHGLIRARWKKLPGFSSAKADIGNPKSREE
jgi:hypothetical protein